MQKEKFEFTQGVHGCEWALIAPIATSLLFALIGAIYCSIGGIPSETLNDNAIFMTFASIGTELSFLLTALLIARRARANYIVSAGLKKITPWWTYLGAIILSVIVLFCLNPIINCWQYFLQNVGHSGGALPFEMNSVGTLFLGIILFALIPAICEESLFRGVILNGLRSKGLVLSVGVSATFFSVMHMNLLQFPYTFLLGIVLGLVVYFTQNLWLSIIIHFVNNATVLIIGFLSNTEAYRFVWTDILWGVGGLIVFGIVIYLLYLLLKKQFSAQNNPNKQEIVNQNQQSTNSNPQPTASHLQTNSQAKLWIAPIFMACACVLISILGGFSII